MASARVLVRRVVSRVATVLLTFLTVALAIGLVAAGRTVLAERAAAVPEGASAPLTAVLAEPIVVEDGFAFPRRFAGQVEPRQESTLAFEIGGELGAILVDEGDTVSAGDRLAQLDVRLLEAEKAQLAATREALESQAELARRTTSRRDTLQRSGFTSSQALDEAELSLREINARLSANDAETLAVDVRLSKAELVAPFDGIVSARLIDAGSIASAGAPVISLVETEAPRLRVGLSPRLVEAARRADEMRATFGGVDQTVRFHSTLPKLDPRTRTRPVLFTFAGGDAPAFGQTGELHLTDRVEAEGAWVDNMALLDDPRGLWRLLTVEEREDGTFVVGARPVQVLHAEAGRSYVRGALGGGLRYVADGVHRVTPGETVTLAPAEIALQ